MSSVSSQARITSVRFKNYKALRTFQLWLTDTNFLIGPNNAGKSTIISAFRVLSVALRRVRGKRLDIVDGPKGRAYGIAIPAEALPISIENVHTNLADEDTTITFRISNGNELQLFFPKDGPCLLIADAEGTPLGSPASFRNAFPISLAVIPVLGPVDHAEKLVLEETVERNLTTHRASGNFRSYWYRNDSEFEAFAEAINKTWPGMQIKKPEIVNPVTKELMMFCEESRIPRELYWIGSGFQIWCQLLTHIMRVREASLVVIDEPEIYLHADLQRQLVGLLRNLETDVLLATHSTEIMGEADPHEMVLVDKRNQGGERLKNVEKLQAALAEVGSVHNISLSRLARSRKVVFFEGDTDFKIIRRFAKQLGYDKIASGIEIFPAQSEGFGSWEKVSTFGWGIAKAFESQISIGAVFDRDFFPDQQIETIQTELNRDLKFSHIHARKEIENYLLLPKALYRALISAVKDRAKRNEVTPPLVDEIEPLLMEITDPYRVTVSSQLISKEIEYKKRANPNIDLSTLQSDAMRAFERRWQKLEDRLQMVPGREVLQSLRERISQTYAVSLTDAKIIESAKPSEIPSDLHELMEKLEQFRSEEI
jgi:energy-coupling factor transporter ATP-binding protein EcfA2